MKKKTYLAVMTLGLFLVASGCGKQEEQKAAEHMQSEMQEEPKEESHRIKRTFLPRKHVL